MSESVSLSVPSFDSLAKGDPIGTREYQINRVDLVRYAGASGDFNRIHWDEAFATSVGLPNVIAHGMYTMAVAGNIVSDWVGDPGAILDYQVKFVKPVPVAAEDATTLTVTGSVFALDEEEHTATLDLEVTVAGEKVLGKARAVVRCK